MVWLMPSLVAGASAQSAALKTNDTVTSSFPWWEDYPLITETNDLTDVQKQNATVGFSGDSTDAGWGIYGQAALSLARDRLTPGDNLPRIADFHAAGLKTIAYFETFGTATNFIAELGPKGKLDYTPLRAIFWNWEIYKDGPTAWVGPQNYFDCEPVAGIYNRRHPRYGGPPMTYPDGTVATGYKNNDASDPRGSRVLDAASSKNILGIADHDYGFNETVNAPDPASGRPRGPLKGLIDIKGRYAGVINCFKDTACPMWIDLQRASILCAVDGGLDGIWADNFSPWDSYSYFPVKMAFGDWSVAGFRDYLARHFSAVELKALGVADVKTFDVRSALRSRLRAMGGNDTNLDDPHWSDARWLDEPLWHAYMIYKRQTGTAALRKYYQVTKEAAGQAGKPDFLVMGNDIPLFSLGWPRGELDMVSTEMSSGNHMGASARGIMLPPQGRFAPVYKLAREHAKSRLVNVWFYLQEETKQYQGKPGIANVLEYEMLATHALPMLHPRNPVVAGTAQSNAAFFKFVKDARPTLGRRVPVEEIGIYYSSSSLLAFMTPAGFLDVNHQPQQFGYYGWGTALDELHYQYRAVPEWKLNREMLASLRVLIIPDAEVLDPADVDGVLLPWVKAGGLLIVTGKSGYRLGEPGNFAVCGKGLSLAGLTGVSSFKDAPAEKLSRVGEGSVLYLRDNIGMEYYVEDAKRASLRPRFEQAMRKVLETQSPPVLTAAPEVPSTIALTLYEDAQARRLFVDVNNLDIDLARDVVRPSPLLKFSVKAPAWVKDLGKSKLKARVLAPGTAPAVTLQTAADRLEIELAPVQVYACVVVEPAK